MHTKLLLGIWLLLSGVLPAQSSYVYCTKDSAVLTSLHSRLVCQDSSYARKHIPVYYSDFAHADFTHEYCGLLACAMYFDQLLECGVDLCYDAATEPPLIVLFSFQPLTPEEQETEFKCQERFSLLVDFVRMQECYIRINLEHYKEDLKAAIDHIIQTYPLRYSETVQRILMGEYWYLDDTFLLKQERRREVRR